MPSHREPAPPPTLPNLRFQSFLNSGGFADVYLYEQEFPRQRVAVKVLHQRRGALDEDFVNEANRLAGLSEHPNIVRISAANVSDDGRAYMVMEYCPPPHLGERCRPNGLPVDEALRIGVKMCGAIAAAHGSGILHRDIKPANILLRTSKEPVLIDFGIAGERRGAQVDEGLGVSVPYAAPEILFDGGSGDETSDLYSLGATIYALAAGRSPYEVVGGDNSQDALLSRMRTGRPPRTNKHGVPDALEALFEYGLARRPDDRPSSAAALARALQEVERGLGYRPTDFFDGGPSLTPEPVEPRANDPDGTRAQIQVVAPEARAPRAPAPAEPVSRSVADARFDVPDALTGSRRGDDLLDALEARTAGRPRPVAPETAPEPDGRQGTGSRRGRMAAGLIVAAAVVAVVAASLLGKGKDPGNGGSTNSTGTSETNTLFGLAGVTNLVAVRSGTTLHLTWTDGQNPTGTGYVVSYKAASGETIEDTTTATSYDLTAAPANPLCVDVAAKKEGEVRSSPVEKCA